MQALRERLPNKVVEEALNLLSSNESGWKAVLHIVKEIVNDEVYKLMRTSSAEPEKLALQKAKLEGADALFQDMGALKEFLREELNERNG